MPPAVPAKPQGFVFKMRLIAPNGTPFGSMKYRLKWGSKLIPEPPLPPRTTGPNGEIAMLLDAATAVPPQGVLLAIDQAGPNENIVWSIPLQLAQDPPPTGMPGIDRAPAPPPASAPPAEMQRHQDELTRHRTRVLAQIRERLFEFWQVWDELKAVVTLGAPPPPTAGDDELWEAWQAFVMAFLLVIKGYEAAWRLYNLADLPTELEPTLPFMSSDFEKLLRAMDRFAFRHGLTSPLPEPTSAEAVDVCLEAIQKTHDHRHPMSP